MAPLSMWPQDFCLYLAFSSSDRIRYIVYRMREHENARIFGLGCSNDCVSRQLCSCKTNHLLCRVLEAIKCMQRKTTFRNLYSSQSVQRQVFRIKSKKHTILWPASSFVPLNRTTTGTLRFKSRNAMIIPSAIMSPRVRPPKMLTKMARTRGSETTTRNEDLTVSLVALPPVSRKLAQWPPWWVRASTVFMARPAPFTFGLVSPALLCSALLC